MKMAREEAEELARTALGIAQSRTFFIRYLPFFLLDWDFWASRMTSNHSVISLPCIGPLSFRGGVPSLLGITGIWRQSNKVTQARDQLTPITYPDPLPRFRRPETQAPSH